jgi:hypothetical protein
MCRFEPDRRYVWIFFDLNSEVGVKHLLKIFTGMKGIDGMTASKIDPWERNQSATHLHMMVIC